jgi:quercetin dioxygenase-like cupin family protein
MSEAPRRVVTGHDGEGRSVVLSDGANPTAVTLPDGTVFHELWSTHGSPAPIAATQDEPVDDSGVVVPRAGGTFARFCDIPPGGSSPMHRTETIDVGYVISGEITMLLDDGSETVIGAGGVVVQRGTNHQWFNRSEGETRMLFVLTDGAWDPELRETITLDTLMERPG